MKIEITGNPGTGNSFSETNVNIGYVQTYNPNATTVVVNNYGHDAGDRKETAASRAGTMHDEQQVAETCGKVLAYVAKVGKFAGTGWEEKHEQLWNDILQLREVRNEVCNIGRQQSTEFNRILVAGIIHVLKDNGVYRETRDTEYAKALEGDPQHAVRGNLSNYPAEIISQAVKDIVDKMRDM